MYVNEQIAFPPIKSELPQLPGYGRLFARTATSLQPALPLA
jgi:hypothetical protein